MPKLIDRLLEDAEKWTLFRSILQEQIDDAGTFRTKYSKLEYDDKADDEAMDDLEETIKCFAEDVSRRITQLDELSQSLIQLVSILTFPKISYKLTMRVQRIRLLQRLSTDLVIAI